LIGILNSGHRKSSAVIVRRGGEGFKDLVQYSTWAPKAIASIRDLPDTLMDRSIPIRLRRKTEEEKVDHFRTDRTAEFEIFRRQAIRWVIDNVNILQTTDPDIPVELQNRIADNWRPLITIADTAGGRWPRLARQTALIWNNNDSNDISLGTLLLMDLRALFRARAKTSLSTKEILTAFVALEDRPWSSYQGKQCLSDRDLSGLLRSYGIKPTKIRTKGSADPVQGYKDSLALQDTFRRFLPPEEAHQNVPEQPEQSELETDDVPDVPIVPRRKGPQVNLKTGVIKP
jgi:hypothetical protein